MLISGVYPKIINKLTLLSLVLFSLYLLLIWIFQGNKDNCNCFGTFFTMTPVQSILKNLILIVLMVFVSRLTSKEAIKKYQRIIFISIIIVSLLASFLLSPIILKSGFPEPGQINYEMNFDPIYNSPDTQTPEYDLTQGKWIIVFVSSSCEHCIIAGYKFSVIKSKIPDIKLYFFINGTDADVEEFHFLTKTRDIPYSIMLAKPMVALTGAILPSILWLDNGYVVNKTGIYNFTEKEIENWLLL